MPHWCLSFTTWLRCWAQFITQLDDKAGGYGVDENEHYLAMRNGLIALQNIATALMQASPDQDATWLMVAHLIIGRLHRLCISTNPSVLRESTTMMEEREAANRAAAVTVHRLQTQSVARAPRSGPHPNKKARPTPSGQQKMGGSRPSGPRDGCPYHGNTKSHSIFDCHIFKELSRSQHTQSSSSAQQG